MAVRLMYPTYLFHTSFLHEPRDKCSTMTEEYFGLLRNEMDAIRKRDKGRSYLSKKGYQSDPILWKEKVFESLLEKSSYVTETIIKNIDRLLNNTLSQNDDIMEF